MTQGTGETVVAVARFGKGEEKEVEVRTFPVREVPGKEICDTNGAGWVVGSFLSSLLSLFFWFRIRSWVCWVVLVSLSVKSEGRKR